MTAMSETKKAALSEKYAAYPEYKDSGIEWLGEIPTHWKPTQIKHIGKLKGGAGFPHIEQGISNEELQFHKVNALGKADSSDNLIAGENTISAKTAERLGAFIFPPKSIVFAKVGAALLLSRIRTLKTKSCIDNNMMGLVVNNNNYSTFIKYAMHMINFDYIVNPGAIPSLNEFQMGNWILPMPSKKEQTQIAAFLDHETAKIDTLIEKQQQLIELLKEKRQAVISHAVTKGLNPDAPMKNSGVEWLGEVPEHWGKSNVKHLCYVNDGNHGEEYPTDRDFVENPEEGVPFIRGGDFDNFRIIDKNLRYLSHKKNNSMRKGRLQENDILFVNRGATIGKLCIIDKNYIGSNLNSQVAYLRVNSSLMEYRYLTYFLSSKYIQTKITAAIQGGALPQYSIQHIINLDIWSGDFKEQVLIANYLDQQINRITLISEQCELAINLLHERRTALISAAVTGKIDVRHFTLKDGVAPATNSDENEAAQEVTA